MLTQAALVFRVELLEGAANLFVMNASLDVGKVLDYRRRHDLQALALEMLMH